jgi:hypothetical protein
VTNKPAPRISWVLLVVLVVALATGAAASILVAASTAPPPSSGTASLVILPEWTIAAISWGVVALVVGSLVVWRLTSGPSSALTRVAVSILAVVLLGVLFVVGARFLGVGGMVGPGGSGGVADGNSGTPPNNTTVITGQLNGTGGEIVLFPSLPGWVPLAVLGIVVLLVVVVGVPQTRRYLAERREGGVMRRRTEVTVPAGMREALTRASTDLDLGGDPRAVILALYAAMLTHLQPMVADLGTSTPEEIRAAHLVRLGVRPEAARTLTRLFEEARYSTHPMGPAESVRAQEAVRATLDDLARRTFHE